jgi:hypothetical protein
MLCCYLTVFVFVYIIDLKEYSFHFYVYINECIDVNTGFKKFFQISELFG